MLSVHEAPDASNRQRNLLRALPLLALAVLIASLGLLAQPLLHPLAAHADAPHIDSVTFARDVDPAAARFLTDAISAAETDGSTLLVINLDTPGGDLDSMKSIVQKELSSTVPIVVYVSPPGGRAASAGTFLALAAPVVAMAPTTRIGAASPVDAAGDNIPSTLDTKIKNDLEAQMRSLQTMYHRNVDLAVQTIERATSYNDQEAIQQNLVNFGADSQSALYTQLDGMSVTLANQTTTTLHTVDQPTVELQPTLANQVETVFLDPTILFLLFIVAAICIYLELAHPGAIVPGTVGAIALVFFLFGAGSLNPNWTGLVLMLLAIVLLAVDVRVPTHGVLTVGALICLVVGSLIFFDSGANRGAPTVSPIVIGAMAAGVGLVSAIVLQYIIRVQRGHLGASAAGLVGQKAIVITPLAPEGRVKVLGENWSARLAEPAASTGMRVEPQSVVVVVATDGLTLIVEPALP